MTAAVVKTRQTDPRHLSTVLLSRLLSAAFLCVSCGGSKSSNSVRTNVEAACATAPTSSEVLGAFPAVFPVTTKGYTPTFLVVVASTDAVTEVMRLTEKRNRKDASWVASYQEFAVVESSSKPESDADGCALADLVRPVAGALVIDLRRDDRPTILAHSR
jgi:hypothetical protein